MRTNRKFFGLAAALLLPVALMLACSDDDKPKDQGVDTIDGSIADTTVDSEPPPDLGPDLPPVESNMGEGCKNVMDCKKGSPVCLTLSKAKGLGICSMECTPDDASTPLINEDNCPNDFVCASFAYTTATYNYCLKKCTPDITKNTCPASSKQTCHPASTRFGDTDQAVCWYLACEGDKDCPVFSDQTCVTDGECSAVGTGAFCEPETSKCALPGKCTASGLCGAHTHGKAGSKVGDPCKDDFDCPNAGRCFEEGTDTGAIGATWRNGYCTISSCAFASALPDFACPTGSTCNHLYYGGICAKTCKLDDAIGCRNNPQDKGGDYECYAWNNLVIGSTMVAKQPTCEPADPYPCNFWGTTSLDCTVLGQQGNPTQMACRQRSTGSVLSSQDPGGFCLDTTASGN